MASVKLGFAGFHVTVSANRRSLTVSGSVSNRLWRGVHARLREWAGRERAAGEPKRVVPVELESPTPEQRALLERANAFDWYHSIALGHGIVTKGQFDHAPYLERYCLPERLDGMRVLDVATFDGYWAFELERRGAAEVVAIDLPRRADVDLSPRVRAEIERDLPPEKLTEPTGRGFEMAREALGSKVERHGLSVYDLSTERLGTFDVVHVGDVLLHLKHPLRAIENVRAVTRGYALFSESYHPDMEFIGGECPVDYLGGVFNSTWWRFSLEALRRMLLDAGFSKVEVLSTFKIGYRGGPATMHHAVLRAEP